MLTVFKITPRLHLSVLACPAPGVRAVSHFNLARLSFNLTSRRAHKHAQTQEADRDERGRRE